MVGTRRQMHSNDYWREIRQCQFSVICLTIPVQKFLYIILTIAVYYICFTDNKVPIQPVMVMRFFFFFFFFFFRQRTCGGKKTGHFVIF